MELQNFGRAKKRTCKRCGKIYKNYKNAVSLFCQECKAYRDENQSFYKAYTIEKYLLKKGISAVNKSEANAAIRSLGKIWLKNSANDCCENCFYDLHVEICHIKPVSSFKLEDMLGDVHHKRNILTLCRNCHWEFDRGQLTLETLISKKER